MDLKQISDLMKNASPEAIEIKDAFIKLTHAKDPSQKTLAFIDLIGKLNTLKGEGSDASVSTTS